MTMTAALSAMALLLSSGCTPKPGPPRLVNQIGVLTVQAKDPAALARWYETQLGLYSTAQPDGSWAGRTASGADNIQMTWRFVPGRGTGSDPIRVTLNVSDLQFYVDRLTKAGFPPIRQVNDIQGLRATFRDPEGNEVELVQAGTASPEV